MNFIVRFLFRIVFPIALGLLAGCARFHAKPLSPTRTADALESRSLTNAALKVFLETNLQHEIASWPPAPWDLDLLTLAAFYYHPDLAVARAQWDVAKAGIKTAGGRPNPTLTVTPGYNTTTPTPTPWLPAVNLDWPIETAGKRGHRMDAARELSESARFSIAATAWQIRKNLRASLADFITAQQRETQLQKQTVLQEQIVNLLEQQAQAGAVSRSETVLARIALQKIRLDFLDAQRMRAEARARLAESIGVPMAALDAVGLPADLSKTLVPPADLLSVEARRAALQSRSDVLSSLADYAAAQAMLQTEIAKQYPDVHLNPGYQYDQGENKWTVGITVDLPILNQNQGPIAEAEARREEAAAKFNAVQSRVLAEIERAVEVFRVVGNHSDTVQTLAVAQAKQLESVEAQFRAGAVDRLDLLNAQFEFAGARLAQLDAEAKVEQATAQLENAVQRPFETWPALEQGRTAQASQP